MNDPADHLSDPNADPMAKLLTSVSELEVVNVPIGGGCVFMIDDVVARFVTQWAPADVVADGVQPLLDVLRSWVVQADPRSVREARCALRWAFAYLAATGVTAATADPVVIFAVEPIESYLATLNAPTGTKDAMRSHLRRLHPALGFAGTTRTAPAVPVKAPLVVPPVQPVSSTVESPAVSELLNGWTPSQLPADRWAHVEELVTAAVAACDVRTKGRATDLARCVAYLAAWADNQCRGLQIETVLSAATIEEFLSVLAAGDVPVGSLRTFAANLHAVRTANRLPLDVVRVVFPKPDRNDPYTAGEVAAIFEQAARIGHATRRRHATAALDLLFGAGAFPGEVANVQPGDVTSTDALTLVSLSKPQRVVPVLERYATRLTASAAADEQYVLGGTGSSRYNRFRQVLGATSSGQDAVAVSGSRARATWLVEAATTPGLFDSMAQMWEASGLRTAQCFDQLAGHIRPAKTVSDPVAEVLHLPTSAESSVEWAVVL